MIGIEYAIVKERSKNYPTHLAWYAQNHVTNIEEMLNTIIYPLDRCDGIEALRGGIDYTATALRDGSLRSVREVEVSLISNGKVSIHEIASFRDLLTNDSHPACPHKFIRDTLTPLPLLVTSLCMKQA